MSPSRLVYGKACHLHVELQHKSYWAIKKLNVNHDKAGAARVLQVNELKEVWHFAYESAEIYNTSLCFFVFSFVVRDYFDKVG